MAATVAASEEETAGNAPGAFQLPPYKQAQPIIWYKPAESLMDMRKITNPAFRLVLVQCALPDALQETVAHILEADIPASTAYAQLKAELTRMHEKTSWDWLAKLFALPPCGAQKGTELLAAMERLKPKDPELWFRWMYFSRLPEWIQRQLAENTLPVRELAKRVDKLQRKVPPPANVAAVPTPAAEIAVVEKRRPHKKTWPHKKPDSRKRRRSDDSDQGGQGDVKKKARPWENIGICRFHHKFGDKAWDCKPPCLLARNKLPRRGSTPSPPGCWFILKTS